MKVFTRNQNARKCLIRDPGSHLNILSDHWMDGVT